MTLSQPMITLRHVATALQRCGATLGRAVRRLTIPGIDIRDVFLVTGLVLLFYGLWRVWEPLSFVVVGALLIRLALLEPSPAAPAPHPGQEKRLRHGAR